MENHQNNRRKNTLNFFDQKVVIEVTIGKVCNKGPATRIMTSINAAETMFAI